MRIYGKEEMNNLAKVLESGVLCDRAGGFMDQFRHDFAAAMGSKHAITAATAMLLMQAIPAAIGAGPGDEIICDPIVQFHAIACLFGNVVPVWADIRASDYLMDPRSVEERITPRTKAIWVTHLWGYPAEVDTLRAIADRHGIVLLEDCAHIILGEYKGRKVGTFGHIGTFSFNMFKQLALGEGGMAITDDDRLAFELNRRIIFGESPEVLSSNYRMTELQAAVGVEQLKRVPGYLEQYRANMRLLDEAIAGCRWLDARVAQPSAVVAPYFWSCLFRGEREGIEHAVFKAALRQAGGGWSTGFLQVPAYQYAIFRNPNAYNNKGCPYNCHMYTGKVQWDAGLCPVAEDVIPRLVHTNAMVARDRAERAAEVLRKAIALAESGNVEPLTYSDLEQQVLQVVKEKGPIDPTGVIRILDERGWGHYDEHTMFTVMENLRDRYPRKLSHAGPRDFAYHDLS
ncbi:MAG: DegT/DnrJ/EryC1/StrS family aminotransferase [Anaerolineae bacterium]